MRLTSEECLRTPEIPSEDTIIALGRELLDSTVAWKKGKTFAKGKVLTLSRFKGPADGAPWHCRVSEHTKEDATFDEFWGILGVNKAEKEKEWDIPSCRLSLSIWLTVPLGSLGPLRRLLK